MDRLIKVFGERNTATRAVLGMIDAASGIQGVAQDEATSEAVEPFDAMIEKVEAAYRGPWKRVYREAIKDLRAEHLGPLGAWKHSAPVYDPVYREEGVGVIFMVRNPYSWITSLHRRPYHNMGRRLQSLTDFLDLPWMTVGRDNLDRILPSPVMLWPLKIRAYRGFEAAAKADGVACTWVRFEEFVQFPVPTLARALRELNLPSEGLTALARSTKPFGALPKERRAFYGQELWREALCHGAVARVNASVDWDLAAAFGYNQLDAAEFPLEPRLAGEGQPAALAADFEAALAEDEDEPGIRALAGADRRWRRLPLT